MKQFESFVGIDVSKATLDFSVVQGGKQTVHLRIENKPKAIGKLLKVLAKEYSQNLAQAVFCMEYTGIYNNHLLQVLREQKLDVWMESAVQIKRSMGLQRGKNDRVDARRIAMYAYRNRDEMKLWKPAREQVQKLKQLFGIRKRLLKTKGCLKKPLGELSFLPPEQQKILKSSCRHTLRAIEKDIEGVDRQIDQAIREDEHLQHIFKLATSVKGIGRISAIQMMVATNEFKSITEAKKFACFAGVAPFEHTSGTSVRGKTRVSNMADKSIKSSLHMAALAAIREKGELQDYFLRKVEQGKNKMSVLNAVRNKLIHRVFACVRDDRAYCPGTE